MTPIKYFWRKWSLLYFCKNCQIPDIHRPGRPRKLTSSRTSETKTWLDEIHPGFKVGEQIIFKA
ncbi:hypothetical protein G9A89_008945 [Geosiphon pyriformis]|nr:hypothetical protein G9A89_008945 [Geosiphon pyriformis]